MSKYTPHYNNIQAYYNNKILTYVLLHLRIAAELLKKGARTEIKDDDRKTPLHCATSNGHFDTVKLLLNNQAYIDSVYVKRCVLTNLHIYVRSYTISSTVVHT